MTEKPSYEELQQRVQELEQEKDVLKRKLETVVEDDLIRDETLFRGLFNNMSSGSAIYKVVNDGSKGSDYIIRGFNQTSLKLEGKTLDEVLGKSLFDLRPNIDDYGLIPVMKKVWETGTPAYFPIKIYQDEKFSNYYENRIFRIPSGEVVTIYNDVTEQKNAEKALVEREERLALAMEFANDGLFDWNLETHKIYYSPAWKKLLGYDDNEIENEFSAWERLTKPEDVKASWVMLNDLLEGKRDRFEMEFQMLHKDGHWVDILSRANVIFNTEGKGVRVIGTHVDITARKRLEAEMRRREMLHREAQRVAKLGHWELDTPSGTPIWSEEIFHIFGLDPKNSEPSFANHKEIIHERDWGLLEDAINSLSTEGTPFDIEFRILRADGGMGWMHAIGSADRDETGNIIRMFGTAQDITRRKEMEEALRISEEKFSKFFYSSPTWLAFTALEDGKYLEVNESFERVSGFRRNEVVGRTSQEVGLIKETEERGRLMSIAREKGGFQQKEIVFFTKQGNPLPVLWSAVVVEMDGKNCLLSTVMDISELKRAEEEKESLQKELQQAHKMEAIGNLAGGIAHEFNNVLGIILGNAELAMDDVPDWNPAKASLKEIRTASFRAKEVVRQILSFARKTMTALKPLELNTIVKESLKLMRASIPTMVDVQSKIPSEPKVILGDPTEIHQIVINLCTNAAHAMKETGGILEVGISEMRLDENSAMRYEDLSPGDFIRLTVKDSGEGITPDVLKKVFEPYFTTKEFGAGSGMGLAVVYGLVKKCKGAIEITSTVGEGTTVEILFPKIEEQTPPTEKIEGELPTGKEKILLVDDDPSIVNMIRQMLERMDYTVSSTTESTSALELFKSAPDEFDLVITDMSMPKMSGDQLAGELIKVRKGIPILLCTGHSDTVNEKKAKEIGIKGFAMKPLDKAKLARAVRAILDKNHDA